MAVIEVTLTGTILGQTHENIFHMQKSPWNPLTDYAPMAAHLNANWLGQVKTFAPVEFVWTNIRLKNITTPAEPVFSQDIMTQGTSSGIEGMPPFVCFLFRFQTATGGRTGKGRYYQSSPNPGHVVRGLFTASMLAFYAPKLVALANFYGPAHSSDYLLGVCTRGNAASFKGVQAITMDTIPRVQRRRNIGVGL